jgi:hypothetical protein
LGVPHGIIQPTPKLPLKVSEEKSAPNTKKLIRNFLLEMLIYGGLVTAYFFVVLQFLSGYLNRWFETNLVLFAVMGLILIVAQGILLDLVTSFLMDQIKLERLE